MTFLCKRSITVWCKVHMTFLFVGKIFHLVSWTQHYKIMKAFWASRNILYIIVWYLTREFKYSPSAIHHCSSSLISQTISSNIFYGAYSSGTNWNGIGTRNVQISCKNIFEATTFAGSTFKQMLTVLARQSTLLTSGSRWCKQLLLHIASPSIFALCWVSETVENLFQVL